MGPRICSSFFPCAMADGDLPRWGLAQSCFSHPCLPCFFTHQYMPNLQVGLSGELGPISLSAAASLSDPRPEILLVLAVSRRGMYIPYVVSVAGAIALYSWTRYRAILWALADGFLLAYFTELAGTGDCITAWSYIAMPAILTCLPRAKTCVCAGRTLSSASHACIRGSLVAYQHALWVLGTELYLIWLHILCLEGFCTRLSVNKAGSRSFWLWEWQCQQT